MINKVTFEEILTDASLLSAEKIPLLKQLLEDFPFCQTLQLLYLKSLQLNNDIRFEQRLGFSSTYATDRKLLKQYLYPDKGIVKSIKPYQPISVETIEIEEEIIPVVVEERQDEIEELQEEKAPSIVDKMDEIEWLRQEISSLRSENEKIKLLIDGEAEEHLSVEAESKILPKEKVVSFDEDKEAEPLKACQEEEKVDVEEVVVFDEKEESVKDRVKMKKSNKR